jgi:nucleotide-binding universal stress UspA family protein
MTHGPFARVLVPVEFEAANEHEIAADRSIEVGKDHWIALARPTVQALRLAAKLAAGGTVHLVHATPDLLSTAVYGGPEGTWLPASTVDELNRTAMRQSEIVLQKAAVAHCAGVKTVCEAGAGAPLDVILGAAREHPPDAIVLAASTRGRVRRVLLGSTADKVIRQSICPVIVVPSGIE